MLWRQKVSAMTTARSDTSDLRLPTRGHLLLQVRAMSCGHLILLACTLSLLATLFPTLAQAQLRPIDRVLFEPQPLAGNVAALLAASLPGPAPSPSLQTANAAPADNSLPDTNITEPDPADADSTEADIARYAAIVAEEELANGPFTPNLLDPFLALGRLYQQLDEHEAALEALGKAEYISRINEGLYAPQQFEIVKAMIQSHLATGDLAQANLRQQYLLFIQQEYYGEESLQVVPALEMLAEWNMDAFRSMLNQINASGFAIGLNTRAGGSGRVMNPRVLAFGNLFVAQRNFYQAIINLVTNRDFRNPLLPELEQNLIEAIFLGANREAILEDPDFYLDKSSIRTGSRIRRNGLNGSSLAFQNGRNAWQRMRIYLENDPRASSEQIAEAIIGMGDWHLLFNRTTTALDYYREAHAFLQARQVPERIITAMLAPAVPQQLPDFTPRPHSRAKFGIAADTGIGWDGHIDVSFSLTRFGNVRGLKLLDTSGNVSPELERRLRRLLRSAPFRPRIIDGTLAEGDAVTLRYYFANIY